MKTLFKSIFIFAAAAAALVSCSKETVPSQTSDAKTIKFTVSTDDTKTSFTDLTAGKYPTIWNEGDKVKVIANYKNSAEATVTPLEDGKKASFTVTLKTPETKPYVLSALSPSSAFVGNSETNSSVTVTFLSAQTPSATSVDPAAQLLGGVKNCGDDMPEEIAMPFKHIAAYALVSFSNLNLGGAAIQSVNISSDAKIAGRYYWKPADNSLEVNSGSSTVSVTTTSSTNIWVAVAPVAVTSLKFVINTDKGTFTKEVSVSKTFTSGHVAKINVDMAGIPLVSSVKYVKVTSATDLAAKVGYEFIIASATANYAIGTTQNSNNRGASAITKSGDYIIDPSDVVERFILEEGSETDSYAFYAQGTTSGYIYAAGAYDKNNYLRTNSTLDKSGSWDIAFTEGNVSITSKDTDKNGAMRYNSSSNIFSCYKTSTDKLALYTLEGGSPVVKKSFGVDKTAISATADETSATFNVTGNVAWTISCPTDVTASPASGTGATAVTLSFPKNTESTQKKYEISVSTEDAQIATKELTVTLTQSAKGATTTIASVLSECATLASGSSSTSTYDLNNVSVMTVAKQYVIIGDETGTILYYKSNSGLSVGNIVNVSGATVKNYNNLLEISSATVAVQSGTSTLEYETPVEFNASGISSYIADTPYSSKYAHLTGTLNEYIVTVEGTETVVNLYSDISLTEHSGKSVDVYGYAVGYNSSSNKVMFAVKSITSSGKAAGAITAASTKTLAEGEEWTIGATSNSGATISYSSDNTSVATVDASTGKVTAVKTGSATITMTCPATADYTEATATCVVTVEDASFQTLSMDFEKETSEYSNFTFDKMTSKQTNTSLTAHGGSYFGTSGGVTKCSITTNSKISNPKSIAFFASKTSTNTNAASWKVEVSTDNETWTTVESHNAASVTKGSWTEYKTDLSTYSNVYIRIEYDGNTAVRTIDDITIKYK